MNTLYEIPAEKPWPANAGLGNHRLVLAADTPASVCEIDADWRRVDGDPETLGYRLFHLESGEEIRDLLPLCVTRGHLRLRFRAPRAGLYALYTRPFDLDSSCFFRPRVRYMPVSDLKASPEWVKLASSGSAVPARFIAWEGRNAFECFSPMETPALPEEAEALANAFSDRPFLVFAEDRSRPAMLQKQIPVHWTRSGPSERFETVFRPGENIAFQLCVYALKDLHHLRFSCDRAEMTCVNTDGKDHLGRAFHIEPDVRRGEVKTLWICSNGLSLAQTEFTARVISDEGEFALPVCLRVEGEPAPDGGEDRPWDFTRLGWFESTSGLDNETFAGLLPVSMEGNRFFCEGRQVIFGASGLPEQVLSTFSPDLSRTDAEAETLLSAPMAFTFDVGGAPVRAESLSFRAERVASGLCRIEAESAFPGGRMRTQTRAEADGHLDTLLTLTAEKDLFLSDIRLTLPVKPEAARYAVGFGREGGNAPRNHRYDWNVNCANNVYWQGDCRIGVLIKLKHTEDVWEVYTYQREGLPESWYCGGKGFVTVDNGLLTAFCGERVLKKGESFVWRFALNLTPLRKRNMQAHWAQRYYHIDTWDKPVPDPDEAKAGGATVVNLHQGGALNAYINYPFLQDASLREQTQRAHALGMKYKLYYTLRELSNHTCELPVLISLGDEVIRRGPGFRLATQFDASAVSSSLGAPWFLEHLSEGYMPAWQQILADGDYDSAFATQGLSRWHNYYIEGLRYLMEKCGADGLYLDGVGYDREIMKRVRKTMDKARPGGLIDFHSGNNFHPEYGLSNPISQYLELMPCFDRLWIGEGYDFENTSPEYWLVEMTGIPFGLTGEMLGPGGGNPWKGMTFGMSCRMGWQQGGDPTALWKAWDEMGLTGANMKGWWESDCGVSTGRENVKATLFENGSRRFIAVASWEKEDTEISLATDFPVKTLRARFIEGFQREARFDISKAIPVSAGRGYLLEVE